MNSEMKKDALTDEELNKVSGGTVEVMEQLFKPGDWFDNRQGAVAKLAPKTTAPIESFCFQSALRFGIIEL